MYEFTSEETRLFKDVSGIYALLHEQEVIYVGQSKNIRDRLNKHRTMSIDSILSQIEREEGKCNRTKQLALYMYIESHREDIAFVVLKETDNRDKWEEHYITLFHPKFNYRGVDVPFVKAS